MTQSPLSRQIQLLEHAVGVELFDRSHRSVQLTAAGKSFLADAQRIWRLSQEALAGLRRVADGEAGVLTLGFTAGLGCSVIPDVIGRIKTCLPDVRLQLREMPTAGQMEGLAGGVIDLAFVRPFLGVLQQYECAYLTDDDFMLAIPAKHANLWPGEVDLASLSNRRFLVYSPHESAYLYGLMTRICQHAGFEPQVVDFVSHIHTMLALVSVGLGLALIPRGLSRLQFEGVVMRPLRCPVRVPVEAVASYKYDNRNPVLQTVLSDVIPAFLRR